MRLTPDMLIAAYDYMRVSLPFRRWRMPEADTIVFEVSLDKTCFAWFDDSNLRRAGAPPRLAVSTRCVGHTATLFQVMGHEMVHVYQDGETKFWTPHVEHNADFMRRWRLVAKHHGFDPKCL